MHFSLRQAKLSSYFVRENDAAKGKRKFVDLSLKGGASHAADQALAKRAKAEKKKITSFFAPKLNKKLGDTNEEQDLKKQKEDLDPESRLAVASDAEKSASCVEENKSAASCEVKKPVKDKNSSAVNAWSSMFNKAAIIAPLCAGHSEPCARRKVGNQFFSSRVTFGNCTFQMI